MKLQFAVKRVDSQFEGALMIDGKFQRSGSAASVEILFDKFVEPILNASADSYESILFTAEMEEENVRPEQTPRRVKAR